MLTSSNCKMTFSFAITTLKFVNMVQGYKGMESFNLNKLLNQFLDWKITFLWHYGCDLLTNL